MVYGTVELVICMYSLASGMESSVHQGQDQERLALLYSIQMPMMGNILGLLLSEQLQYEHYFCG